ncbi:HEAT repeat domain-containing protein [Sinomicrobium sp.]
MKIDWSELTEEYNNLLSLDRAGQIEAYYDFEEKLLSSNQGEMLQFHYNLMKKADNLKLNNDLRGTFMDRPLEDVEDFLLNRYLNEDDMKMKADVMQILGTLGASKILPYAKADINSDIKDIRYRCNIVIGWLGGKSDLALLNERLESEPDDELRGYAATAMRQLWYREQATTEDILPYLYRALVKEEKEKPLKMIIVVIQDLLNRKFGLQERINEGTITGDPTEAKKKIIKALDLK